MSYVEAAVRRQQLIAAARAALATHGVAKTSLRAIAAEAGVPLATMQYVFPSKQQLLRVVIEDVVEEISQVLAAAGATDRGLDHAVRQGLRTFWSQLVAGGGELQLLQYELTTYALRTAGHEDLARHQYERYEAVVADWCRQAAEAADETSAVPFDRLASLLVAGVDGLILQHLCNPDEVRSLDRLAGLADMILLLADVRPISKA
ncbi:MAG: TetR/AcrR family transcriptional regulator [Nocardioides sp.]